MTSMITTGLTVQKRKVPLFLFYLLSKLHSLLKVFFFLPPPPTHIYSQEKKSWQGTFLISVFWGRAVSIQFKTLSFVSLVPLPLQNPNSPRRSKSFKHKSSKLKSAFFTSIYWSQMPNNVQPAIRTLCLWVERKSLHTPVQTAGFCDVHKKKSHPFLRGLWLCSEPHSNVKMEISCLTFFFFFSRSPRRFSDKSAI